MSYISDEPQTRNSRRQSGDRQADRSRIDNRRRFTLALEERQNDVLNTDKKKAGGISKTLYLRKVLDFIGALNPVFFGGARFSELAAYVQLSNHPLIKKLPALAAAARRDPLQQLLYFLEKGMRQDEIDQREGVRL